jgi:surface protein
MFFKVTMHHNSQINSNKNTMKKNLFSFLLTSAVVLFCTLPMVSVAQTTGDYRTNTNLIFAPINFNNPSYWQRYNGSAWVNATIPPTSSDGVITIRGGNDAYVSTNITLDQLVVDGTLYVNSGVTLTLADGAGDDLFVRNRIFFGATGVVAGAGQLVLGNKAIMQTANVGGVAASITSTNPILTAGVSYWFNGTTAQSTGFTGLTMGTPLNLLLANTYSVTIDRNLSITGIINNRTVLNIGSGVTNLTASAICNNGTFNNCAGATITPAAFTSSAWAVYQSPDSSEPTTESSNIWTNSHKTTAHMYWLKSGSGNNRIVVLKAGSPVNVNAAIDNTTYTANANFGSGTAIDGGFVVYNGAGSQVNITGLIEGTTYHVAVFEYNQNCTGNRNYKTGSPLTTSFVASERPFITEWITTDGRLTIPIGLVGNYNYTVSYRQLPAGIPVVLTGRTSSTTLTGLTNNVTYEISITGDFEQIFFGRVIMADRAKIRNIKQWGSMKWTSMENAFSGRTLNSDPGGCVNLNSNATDVPNISYVTSFKEMFYDCSAFNGGNIGNWNTQNATDMYAMFFKASSFNQPIGNWNTQRVTDMTYTLQEATAFNQPIGNWNTQNVKSMWNLFYNTAFNQPIGNWNTQYVENMSSMFGNTPFNQSIINWNTQNVTNMRGMFAYAPTFNQPIDTWNTQNVFTMYGMFWGATTFNQSLANWSIRNLYEGTFSGADKMLHQCGMNKANYDATLIGWATQDVKERVELGATGLKYCLGNGPRSTLINTKNWVITGDALDCGFSISGNIFADMNNNCIKETGEVNLKSLVVRATLGNLYGMTDVNGNYTIGVPAIGTYQVELLPQVPTGSTNTITAVCPPKTVPVTAVTPNVTNIDFGAKGKICSQLSVNVSVDRFRRCFEGNTYIRYKNIGLIAANSVTIKVELPVDIQAVSSVPVWTSQVGNVLTYNISTIAGLSEGGINLKHRVVCGNEAIRGQARCIKATISPASYCAPTVSPTWDQADLVAKDTCINRKLGRFIIKNVGTGNMADSSNYRIFFDNVIVRTGKVKLLANQEFLIDINNTTQVLRIEVEQTPFHPTGVPAMRFFNRCGAVAFSVAPIVQLPNLTNIAEGSACATILDSYDPNDKQIIPAGVTAQKIVEKDQEVEFQVRFQNEGNDVAYKVIVRDTLDLNLDIATIRTISTSHTGTVSMEGVGQGVVIWTFENINLPAKSVDEVGSNGMITFRIRMNPNLAIGTVIKNKAAIYFDFNSPIITNETLIRIGVLPTDFGNPVHVNTIFPCPTLPSVAVAGANQNISTTTTTLAATPIVKGYGQWRVVQGTGTFSDEFSPTATVTNLSFGLNIFEWKSYLCNNTSSNQVQVFVCPTITISPNSLSNATVGTNYSQTLTQIGGIGAITYSVSAGTLPNGLTLNSTTGEISGIATVVNTFNFTVQAKDVNNCLGTKVYSIQTVCPTITISPNSLSNATVGTNYSQTLTQVGGIGAITYSISAGTLPNGLTLNATTGEISGIATVANTFTFTVQAQDVNNCTGTKAYTIQTICPTITISPANLNNATVGTNYSQTLTQVGGIGAITYSISAGTLPNGLTLNSTTGEISGIATVANTFNFTVQAKDVNNCTGTKVYSIQTVCPTITLAPANLSNATLGTNYPQTLTQVGGIGAITYSISAGTLPNGLTLNSTTGEISGIATIANTFNFTVQAKDVNNCLGTKAYTIIVRAAVVTLPPVRSNQTITFDDIPNRIFGSAMY